MRNFIKAELFLISKNKNYQHFVLSLLIVSLILNVLNFYLDFSGSKAKDIIFVDAVSSFGVVFYYGTFLALLICSMFLTDCDKGGQAKNVISNNLTRQEYFFSKIIVCMISQVAVMSILFVYHIILT